MPRIRQKADEYSEQDFLKEVNARCVWAGIKTNDDLGSALGISASTAGNYKREPGKIRVDVLRKMIRQLKLDPSIVLFFLGYTGKDIRSFAKAYLQ